MGIDIPERVDLLPLAGSLPHIADARFEEAQVHAGLARVLPEHVAVLQSLVARLVRYDQLVLRIAQHLHEADRVLDALARHDPRGLQDHHVAGREAHLGAHVRGVGVRRRRRRLEVEHVGDQDGRHRFPAREFLLRRLVDDHVLEVGIARRESHVQQVVNASHGIPRPLPVEIVVVRDRGDMSFRDQFGDRHPERNVHGDRQHVLENQDAQVEPLHEFIERGLEIAGHRVNPFRHFRLARGPPPDAAVDPQVLGVPEECFRHAEAVLGLPVQPPRVPEGLVLILVKHLGPFRALQRHAVRARKAGGDEPDPLRRDIPAALPVFDARHGTTIRQDQGSVKGERRNLTLDT
ncbi:MAG: hypothetical protein BWY59_01290 [Verrucomicrobia bacterium ADurb.Bin345]|nr:MAG: hypothetical protein BWY59_01290 [Verrucomicrobia bacterium ADurb.Bin345]